MGEGGRPEVRRESYGQPFNQLIERGGGDGRRWTLNGRWWTAYRIRPNCNGQYPKGFIHDLSSVGHGSPVPPPTLHLAVYPNPQCQSLVRYRMQVLLECQFEVGLCLELAALIDFRAPNIVAAVAPTPFVTFAGIVII